MKKFLRHKIFVPAFFLFMFFFFCGLAFLVFDFRYDRKIAKAGATSNVSGFAWSGTTGWIRFNDTDSVALPDPREYGVNIDFANGKFSGFAWSSNVGWIAFQKINVCSNDETLACVNAATDCPAVPAPSCVPDASMPANTFYGNCGVLCQDGSDCTACYRKSDKTIHGWAKIIVLGKNGWIKLRKEATDGGVDYGLTFNPATKTINGWAWNGSVTDTSANTGWIVFNSTDPNLVPVLANPFAVSVDLGTPPKLTNLSAPNTPADMCLESSRSKLAVLRWNYATGTLGSLQESYRVIVKKAADSSIVLDTGICETLGGSCPANGSTEQIPVTNLDYNVSYTWTVEVWDVLGNSSGVVEFDTANVTDGHLLRGGDADLVITTKEFNIYKNEWPKPNFTLFPATPSAGEEVQLTDQSYVFPGSSKTECSDSLCSYKWTVSNAVILAGATASTSIIIFNSEKDSAATSTVEEILTHYSCSTSTAGMFTLKKKLPKWIETK